MSDDLLGVEAGAELVYYAGTRHSFYREAPQLVRQVTVLRTTKTQVIIGPVREGGSELRFRKDDGYVIGGGYGSEQLKRLTVDTLRDAAQSKLRRRVHRAVEVLHDSYRQLDGARVATGPIEVIEKVEPMLRAAQSQLEQVLGVLKPKEKPDAQG